MEKKRNNYIEFLRFLFCMIVFVHHSGHVTRGEVTLFPSGGLAADAFFMLTGYFGIAHMEKHFAGMKPEEIKNGNTMWYSMKYTLLKIAKIYPYVVAGTVLIYLLEFAGLIKSGTLAAFEITERLRTLVVELTLLPLTGLLKSGEIDLVTYRNSPMWYLSAMLIAMPLLLFIAVRFRDLFRHYIVWFLPPMLQGWMIIRFGGVLPWTFFAGFLNSGIIRGFCSMAMGGAIYFLARYLKEKYKPGTAVRILLTVLEIALLGLVVFEVVAGVSGYQEMFALYLIAGTLVLAFSTLTFTGSLGGEKIFGFLGKLSMPVYCIHWGVYRVVSAALKFIPVKNYYALMGIAFALTVLISVLLMLILSKTKKKKA